MASKSEESRILYPYIPFSTFTGFLDRLKNSAIPPVIDRSVLQNMSGSSRTQLMLALKCMRLIAAGGAVTPALRALIKAYNTEEWKKSLATVIVEAFKPIFASIDLDSGTSQQLAKAFKESGNVDGQVLDKAVRFFLTAMKEAGVVYSPHFDARKVRKVGVRKQSKKKTKSELDGFEETDEQSDLFPVNVQRLRFRLPIRGKPDAEISLPSDVTPEDWAILKIQIEALIAPKGGSHG